MNRNWRRRVWTAWVVVVGLVSGSADLARAVQDGGQASPSVAEADGFFAAQDWAKAGDAYGAVVEADPDNAQAWFRLGYALHAVGRLDEAILAHRKATSFATFRKASLYNLACALALNKRADGAFATLNLAIDAGFSSRGTLEADEDLSSLRKDPRFASVLARLDSEGPAYLRQLDFWIGDWKAINPQGKQVGTNRIERQENGYLILENWTGAGGSTGKSVNYYDRDANKWRQIWIASWGNVSTFEGNFIDGAMRLVGKTVKPDGTVIDARIVLTPKPDGTVHHFSENSSDGGKTWTVYFNGTYVPRKLGADK